MKPKSIILRASARRDVDAAIDRYLAEGAYDAAGSFVETLAAAYSHIASYPGTGSPRYAVKLNIGGLRFWALGRYPYLVFYFDMPAHVEVVRVVHGAMDISSELGTGHAGQHGAREPLAAYEIAAEWD